MRVSYFNLKEQYDNVKKLVGGRQACAVLILVANEVILINNYAY